MACPLATERVWVEKSKYHDAEKDYFEHLSKLLKGNEQKENVENPELLAAATSTPERSVAKAKKNKKLKNVPSESPNAGRGSSSTNSVEDKTLSEAPDAKQDPEKKDSAKSDEAKAKRKKKKKNNKENSEKSQEALKAGLQIKDVSGKRHKTSSKDSSDAFDDAQRKSAFEEAQGTESPERTDKEVLLKSNFKIKGPTSNQCTLVSEIAKARQHIKNSLERMDGIAALAASPIATEVVDRLAALEKENATLRELVESLKKSCTDTQKRVQTLETRLQSLTISQPQSANKPAPPPAKKEEKPKNDDEDDGVDLFGSDSEDDEEANAIREKRLADYHAKKSKKPALIAKSSVVLDIKPWDDETDLGKMEEEIRKIGTDGLLWGASKLQPVAFGIKKLVLSCVVEDEKVSIDWLTEEIEKLEDYVQSVDVAAFNKI